MKGNVIIIDPRHIFAGIQTNGGITVIEILGAYDLELGEIISGDLESLGGDTVFRDSDGSEISVVIQDYHCSRQHVRDVYKI